MLDHTPRGSGPNPHELGAQLGQKLAAVSTTLFAEHSKDVCSACCISSILVHNLALFLILTVGESDAAVESRLETIFELAEKEAETLRKKIEGENQHIQPSK